MLTETELKMADMMRVSPEAYEKTKLADESRRRVSVAASTVVRTTTNAIMPTMGRAARRLAICAGDPNYDDDLADENGPADSDTLIQRCADHLDCLSQTDDDMPRKERLSRAARCLMAAIQQEEGGGQADPDPDILADSSVHGRQVGVVFAHGNGVRS